VVDIFLCFGSSDIPVHNLLKKLCNLV